MSWISPVFDRTYQDVMDAIDTITTWKNEQSPITTDLKGCLNASDLNRIEGNLVFLQTEFANYGYSFTITSKTWTNSGLPNEDDFFRLLTNIVTLYSAFTIPQDLPDNMLNYNNINKMEKCIYEIKVYLEAMLTCIPLCGTFKSGARRILPLRRT